VIDVRGTSGFLVSDSQGHRVGCVEGPMFGTAPDRPDAVAVRERRRYGRHFIVPATAIASIDDDEETISLELEQRELLPFL
jgi:uncharacterized protein YrrD